MVSYLKHERTFLESKIREYYERNKEEIPLEILKTPLKGLTYEQTVEIRSTVKGLVVYVDDYIHRYNVKLDKNVTLEEALKKII